MENINGPEDRATNAEIREDIAKAQRDAALMAAARESARGDLAEETAVDATIQANQARAAAREMATDRNILGAQLASERAAASNNAFGFYLMVGLVVAALIVTAFYLYWRPNNPEGVNIYAAQPAPTAPSVITPPPPSTSPAPVIPVQPPVIVTPKTPDVHNNISVTPPPAPSTNGENGNESSTNPSQTPSSGSSPGGSDSP